MQWQDIWKFSVALHITFVAVWLGGNILLFFIGPEIRSGDISTKRKVNRTFKVLSWTAFFGLFATGILNLIFRVGLDFQKIVEFFISNRFFHTKISLVVLLGIFKGLHDFVFGPRAKGKDKWFYLTYSLAILNTLILLTIIYLSVRVVRG